MGIGDALSNVADQWKNLLGDGAVRFSVSLQIWEMSRTSHDKEPKIPVSL